MSVKEDWPRRRQISQKEYDLRWDYMNGKLGISENEMIKRIEKIRKES